MLAIFKVIIQLAANNETPGINVRARQQNKSVLPSGTLTDSLNKKSCFQVKQTETLQVLKRPLYYVKQQARMKMRLEE